MPKSYPSEFRRRVLELLEAGGSVAEVARDLEIPVDRESRDRTRRTESAG